MRKPFLTGAIESLQGSLEAEENKLDIVRMDVPTFIRMLEFAREDAKTDMDLHVVTERVIELCNHGNLVTMHDYEDIVAGTGKPEEPAPAQEGLKNATKSHVTVHMKHIDHGNKLTEALEKFCSLARQGGDIEMLADNGDGPKSCGIIGHDVNPVEVEHVIEADDDDDE